MSNTTHRGAQPNIAQAEPVTIGGGILALGSLIIGGLPLFTDALTAEQVGYINLVFAAVVALATAVIRHFTVAKVNVHERQKNGQVIAGAANEVLPEGEVVRPVGQLPERNAEV